jgi:hypothetical protein
MVATLCSVPELARNLLFRVAMRMSSVLNGGVLCLSALAVCGCEGNGALGRAGGSGGAAGGGGASGAGPALCAGATNSLAGCLTDASNAPVRIPLSVGVTVVGVEDVAAGGCGDSGPTRRFTLRGAGQQQWFANFRIPGMPTSLITVGDVIELSVRSTSGSPTISLARSGRPLVFYHYDSGFIGPFPPDLSNYGIVVSDGGIECGAHALPCTTLGHRARVTIGSTVAEVGRGQSAQTGGLSFVLEEYRTQTCVADPSSTIVYDPLQTMEMAGFATP